MQPLYVRIHAADNVGVVVNAEGVQAGAEFASGLKAAEAIPPSHKIALVDLEEGDAILRYGTPAERLGAAAAFALERVPAGE